MKTPQPPHCPDGVKQCTPSEAQQILQTDPQAVLIDCRSPEEYQRVHIPGAILHPLSEVSTTRESLAEAYADRPVIVYCHHGLRSLRMAASLKEAGFSDLYSIRGGIDQWAVEIDPGMVRY